MAYDYLGKIDNKDLKTLSAEECSALCREIRQELVTRVTENGGHLASNLGAVELTLAIHRVFDLPSDRLIFDVGHQSYVHKMLSDRFDRMDALRMPGGISGFQRRDESIYDSFGGGHASTSLSAGVGFAQADKLCGRNNFTVCVVGDGAFTGGMIHEALNNCHEALRLIIILNENEMSISKTTGHFAGAFVKLRNSGGYFKFKRKVKRAFSKTLLGQRIYRFSARQKDRIKRALFQDNYFEQMGVDYLGPIDGHDLKKLEVLMQEAKKSACCTVIHVKTVKGKGYEPAEKDPGKYHGLSPKGKAKTPTFSQKCGELLVEKAKKDEKICAITAAMADGTGLCAFEKAFPARFFDVGIAEEHAMTFAAALSAAGMKPVYAVYSTFMQRCYDQLIHDAALQRLPVTLCIDRAGIATADGPTHHGLFDVSMALSLPESVICAPLDFNALDRYLDRALENKNLIFIRYHSGGENADAPSLPYIDPALDLRGKTEEKPDGVILTYGQLASEALSAARAAEKKGKKITVLVLERLEQSAAFIEAVKAHIPVGVPVVFAEEGILNGGMAERFAEELGKEGRRVGICAVADPFLTFKKNETPYETYGISYKDMLRELSFQSICDSSSSV